MPTLKARELHQKYVAAAKAPSGMHFIGPFGPYRSMEMNHAAFDAMKTVERHFPANAQCSVVVM